LPNVLKVGKKVEKQNGETIVKPDYNGSYRVVSIEPDGFIIQVEENELDKLRQDVEQLKERIKKIEDKFSA
jgi:cell division protein FtsB